MMGAMMSAMMSAMLGAITGGGVLAVSGAQCD
jgi:hypothetical protein